MKNYTINGTGKNGTKLEETIFSSLNEAIEAWKSAGSPTTRGSRVWVTEMDASFNTIQTIHLS